MKEERLNGWNERNDEFVIKIKAEDDKTNDLSGDMPDSFDRVFSFRYTMYHLQLRLVKIEYFLEKFPVSC